MSDRLERLEARLAEAERRITRMEDVEAIKRLQRAYGYYLDKGFWQEIADLFAPDGTIEIAARGVYRRDRIYPFLRDLIGRQRDGLAPGQLMNHMQLQGIVTLSEAGDTAQGRWRAFIQVADHGKTAIWAEGPYECVYRKIGGIWTIASLIWFPTYYTPFDQGWAKVGLPSSAVDPSFPPDEPSTHVYETFPAQFIPPYHYSHPVTGRAVEAASLTGEGR
jgi:hypothetical protein